MRSPRPPPGDRRASFDRRGRIDPIAVVSPRSPRSSSTSSPTASLSPPCLSFPRNAHSYVTPSRPRTRQTPPVPDNTVPCISGPAGDHSFVPHRVPPASGRSICRLFANEALEQRLDVVERHRADARARRVLAGAIREVVGLEVALDALRADSTPAHEEEIRAVR